MVPGLVDLLNTDPDTRVIQPLDKPLREDQRKSICIPLNEH